VEISIRIQEAGDTDRVGEKRIVDVVDSVYINAAGDLDQSTFFRPVISPGFIDGLAD
jgi:hypothetical protein